MSDDLESRLHEAGEHDCSPIFQQAIDAVDALNKAEADRDRLRKQIAEAKHYLEVANEELKDPAWDLHVFSVVATMIRRATAALAVGRET